jgi:hypothetical protein
MKTHLSRRSLLGAGLASLVGSPSVQAANPAVLLELYTSQGCSSCPAADAVIGGYANEADVYVVSLNVDYWDYLGWRDTLAKPEYSKRQFDYGKSRGDMQVYTPQVVANGQFHSVGNSKRSVKSLIERAQAAPVSVPLSLKVTAKEISVSIPQQKFSGDATLWLMAFVPAITQVIERGENAGEKITYHNVVRNMVPAAMWRGEEYKGSWMRDAVMPADCTGCIAVLQQDKTGPLLGLARAT